MPKKDAMNLKRSMTFPLFCGRNSELNERKMKINIYLGDSLKAMESMPDKKYGLAIVDPPYGIGNFTPESDSGSYKKGTKKLKTSYDQNYKWNESTPNINYFNEVKRVSHRQIIWGANYYNQFSKLGGALIWYKNVGLVTQLSQAEIASLSWKKQVDYFSLKKLTGFNSPIEYIHPCEKPVALYKWLLKKYGFNKDGSKRTIFDSHGGSLSIVIACIDMGFDIDIWEIDPDYYRDGVNRVKRHLDQLDLTRETVEINIK